MIKQHPRPYVQDVMARTAIGASEYIFFGCLVVISGTLAWIDIVEVTGGGTEPGWVKGFIAATTLTMVCVVLGRALICRMGKGRNIENCNLKATENLPLLQTIAENVPVALIVTDENGRIVHTNGLASGILGSQIVGRHCREVFDERGIACQGCTFCVKANSRPELASNPKEVMEFKAHRFDEGSGRTGVLLVGRLLTEQRRLQAQLLHRERLAIIGMMAAGIAHDLGSPLASMSSQIQCIEREATGQTRDALFTIRHEVDRLSRAVRELVDFTRRQREDAVVLSVASLAGEALRILRHDPRMRFVKMSLDADPNTPPVRVVADYLMQVILNLIVNALDAMSAGGTIVVRVRPFGNKVRLTVTDSGTGITPEVLSHVFEPFFTTKEPGRGAGLGLGLSRDILAGFGATITLDSSPGKGTTAIVDIPAYFASGRDDASGESTAASTREE